MKKILILMGAALILASGCTQKPVKKEEVKPVPMLKVEQPKAEVKQPKKKKGPEGSVSIIKADVKISVIKAEAEVVLPNVQISQVYPLAVKPGTLMSLSGMGFGNIPSVIKIGKINVSEFLSWSDNVIWFYVPEGVAENDVVNVGGVEGAFNLRIVTDSAIKVVWEIDAAKSQEMINAMYPAYELDEAPKLAFPLYLKGQWGKKNTGFADYASNWDGSTRTPMFNLPGTDIWKSECWFTEENFALFKKKMMFFALEDNNVESRKLSAFESDAAFIIKKEWGSSDDIGDSDTDPGLIVSKKYTKYNEATQIIYVNYAPKDIKPFVFVEEEVPAEPVIVQDTNIEGIDNADNKIVVYQMMTRLFGNTNSTNKTYGTKEENSVGKFSNIDDKALSELKKLGVNCVWYTGVIEHATMIDYSKDGIKPDDSDVVKGRAGSPYAIKDYYDVNPDLANDVKNRMGEFGELVQRTHNNGMKVILDFVPNHVARSYKSDSKPEGVKDLGETDDKTVSFAVNNNFYYVVGKPFEVPKGYNPLGDETAIGEDGKFDENPAKFTGNDIFVNQPDIGDWFETVKLNYGVDVKGRGQKHFETTPDTWIKMKDILLYWTSKGVDGFRCDMAEMVPYEFWGWAITEVKKVYPNTIFIAEIYNTGEYQRYIKEGKFDYLYDKVGTYDNVKALMQGQGSVDIFEYLIKDMAPVSSHMLKFLENHDEQRVASRQFAKNMTTGIPGMVVSSLISTAPVMIYFGQEVGEPGNGNEGFGGEDGRTTIFDYWGAPEHQKWVNGGKYDGALLSDEQKKLRAFYGRLLNFVTSNEAVKSGNYYDLSYFNKKGQTEGWNDKKNFAFIRYTENKKVLVLVNFDRKKTMNTVRIPEKAIDLMKLNKDGKYKFVEKVVRDDGLTIDEEIKGGIMTLNTEIPSMSAMVFEIE